MAILNTDIRSIEARAPTRIDLAGGTVDIWPIYLFLERPVTLNLGIDLYAEATIELSQSHSATSDSQILLKSLDQNSELRLSWASLEQGIQPPSQLVLHYKLLKYFFEKRKEAGLPVGNQNLAFTTRARSPAGAGLGGSSSLSIAMIGALATWAGQKVDSSQNGEQFIEIVRDIETTVIQVPAGLQDYYGAMYGGLQSLRWGIGSHQSVKLPNELIAELENRLLLFYSGQSRNSGINNWALFKGFIDHEDLIRNKFEKIVSATHKLTTALQNRRWKEVGQAISEEWNIRKTLGSGITTPEIDRAFAEAQSLTPLSGKVCGAGGGGCFFIYLPEENELPGSFPRSLSESLPGMAREGMNSSLTRDLKESIRNIFINHGMRPLDFHGVPNGLEVRVNHAALS